MDPVEKRPFARELAQHFMGLKDSRCGKELVAGPNRLLPPLDISKDMRIGLCGQRLLQSSPLGAQKDRPV